jgi:hypothetical protein
MAAIRRRLIIEPKFQAGFTFAFVRGVLVAVAIPAVFTFVAIEIFANNPALNDGERMALTMATHRLLIVFVLASAVLGALSALIGLLLSHRYAGPLKRIESWSARHLLGEPVEELVLRPHDELTNVSATLARIMKQEKRP